MSFSSGAYFGSHSTVSQGRAASAFRLALLVWIGPLSRTRETGRCWRPGGRAVCPSGRASGATGPTLAPRRRAVVGLEPRQQVDEVAGALGRAGEDNQLAAGVVEHTEERPPLRPARRLDPEVRPALGPAVGEVGVGQRLGLVPEQEVDVARDGLLLQQLETQAGTVDGVRVLAALEGVARPPPAVAPFRRTALR